MEFDGDTIEHNIHDINSITLPSVCWIDAVIPPDKENPKIDLVDKVVDPPDRPPTTVLGSRPTLLTPQSKIPVSAVVQVVEKKLKRPPEKSKYGGDQKKKVKQVWRATEVNGLRFKPFHDWFRQMILNAEVPQGPIGYG